MKKKQNHEFKTQSNFNTHTRMCYSLLLILTCLVRHAQSYYIELFPEINATASILELHIFYRLSPLLKSKYSTLLINSNIEYNKKQMI